MESTVSAPNLPTPATTDVQPKATSRLLFVDHIRVFLTVLVVLHHLIIIYAGTGDFYYTEGREDFVTNAIGGWFCSVNQAYFMGLFLLISAYFVPGSYDRKGPMRFLKDRLIRLGIPLAVYSWILDPLFVYWLLAVVYGVRLPFWDFFPGQYFNKYGPLIGAGPLWFVETLLIFSLLYVVWRLLTRTRRAQPTVETAFPRDSAIILFALLLGVAGFLVRLWRPMGWSFGTLNLQLPFFAQYIALFIVGLIAYRRNWLLSLPDKTGRRWLVISVILILLWAPMMLLGGADTNDAPFKGGWYWQSLAYALWESWLCVGMCIGVIYVFRHYLSRPGKLSGFLVPSAYAAYIIHPLVITPIAFAVSDVALYPLLKFGLVAAVVVPLCFVLGALIRKLPYADRVL